MSEYRERSRRRSSGPRPNQKQPKEKINWAQLRLGLIRQCKGTGEWARIHFRRWVHVLHSESGGRWTVGPASFLGVSAALGLALTITTLYSSSYAVTVDGEKVGVVADQDIVSAAIQEVEAEGSSLLGYDYQVEGDIDYQFTLTLKTELD